MRRDFLWLTWITCWQCWTYAIQGASFATSTLTYVQTATSAPPHGAERALEVSNMFRESYLAYRESAFRRDDLRPISRSWVNTRNGWGASMIDALSTMLIMGHDDLYAEVLAVVDDMTFVSRWDDVSVFESTIRCASADR